MSWLDPQRSQEPAGETALREELRALLGMTPRNYFETEPSAELVALADDLRKEARRRNHTARKRSHWMLLAAALPLALAFGGVSVWGIAQKHKAEDLAAAVVQREAEIQRLAGTLKQVDERAPVQASNRLPAAAPGAHNRVAPRGRELVEVIDHPAGQVPQDTQQVKAH